MCGNDVHLEEGRSRWDNFFYYEFGVSNPSQNFQWEPFFKSLRSKKAYGQLCFSIFLISSAIGLYSVSKSHSTWDFNREVIIIDPKQFNLTQYILNFLALSLGLGGTVPLIFALDSAIKRGYGE